MGELESDIIACSLTLSLTHRAKGVLARVRVCSVLGVRHGSSGKGCIGMDSS